LIGKHIVVECCYKCWSDFQCVFSPKAFFNRYGSAVAQLVALLVLAATVTVYSAWGKVQAEKLSNTKDQARYFRLQRDLYLHGIAVFLLLVLVGVTKLWKRALANEKKTA
jgi:hypothetical protein